MANKTTQSRLCVQAIMLWGEWRPLANFANSLPPSMLAHPSGNCKLNYLSSSHYNEYIIAYLFVNVK